MISLDNFCTNTLQKCADKCGATYSCSSIGFGAAASSKQNHCVLYKEGLVCDGGGSDDSWDYYDVVDIAQVNTCDKFDCSTYANDLHPDPSRVICGAAPCTVCVCVRARLLKCHVHVYAEMGCCARRHECPT